MAHFNCFYGTNAPGSQVIVPHAQHGVGLAVVDIYKEETHALVGGERADLLLRNTSLWIASRV